MTAALQATNLAVRFLLELALLAAVALAAWRLVPGPARVVAAVAVPVVLAVLWAVLVHGDGVPPAVRAGAQVAALGLGVAAVLALGAPRLAAALTAAALANAALLAAWQQ